MLIRNYNVKERNDIEVLNLLGRSTISFEAPVFKSIDDIDFIIKCIKNEYSRSNPLKTRYITETVYLEKLSEDPDDWSGEFKDDIRIIYTKLKDIIRKKYVITTFTSKDLNDKDRTYTTLFIDKSISDDDIAHLAYDIIIQNIHLYLNKIGIKSFKFNDRYDTDILTIGRESFKYSDEYAIVLPSDMTMTDIMFTLDYYESICEVIAHTTIDINKIFDHFPKEIESMKVDINKFAKTVKDGTDTDSEYIELLKKFSDCYKRCYYA